MKSTSHAYPIRDGALPSFAVQLTESGPDSFMICGRCVRRSSRGGRDGAIARKAWIGPPGGIDTEMVIIFRLI